MRDCRESGTLLMTSLVIVLLYSGYITNARAFTNGQNASVVIGQKDFTSGQRSISQTGLYYPDRVTFDSSGNMWVAETALGSGSAGVVLEFKPPFANGMQASLVIGAKDFGRSKATPTQSGLVAASAAEFDSSGNLWVNDLGNRVLEFKPPFASGMNASLVIGQKDFASDAPRTSRDGFDVPADLTFDPSGNLWVFDIGNNRILQFQPPFSTGMDASLVIGQPNFDSNSRGLSQSRLYGGLGDLAFDPSGNLWVADGNHRVLEFRPPFSAGMNASLVLGQPDFTSDKKATTQNGFYELESISSDPAGNIWVGDTGNARLLEFMPPFTTNMPASMVIGQKNYTAREGAACILSASPCNTNSNGISAVGNHPAFDSSGNLWIADIANNRVLKFDCGEACASQTSTTRNSPTSRPSQSFGAIQLFAIGTAILIACAGLVAVVIRRNRKSHGADLVRVSGRVVASRAGCSC